MTTQLDHLYRHERERGGALWLTQPVGGGALRTFTFAEGMDEARRIAAHLRSSGLPPWSHVAILSKNTAWWLLADVAVWMAGHVSIPVYPTLAAASVRQVLEHADARLLFVGKLDGFPAMEAGIPAGLPRIALPLAPPMDAPRWDDLVRTTPPLAESPRRDADELATIAYTSGSTGEAKGVMHSFRTMMAALAFSEVAGFGPRERILSYLPLAHVAERALLETTNFALGYQVFFAESLDTFVADLRRARPTVFGGVPRIWAKLHAGITEKLPEGLLLRLARLPLAGGFVRRAVLRSLGLEQAQVGVTGSAPTPPRLLEFWEALGLEILDVYAMSENFAVSHCTRPGEGRPGWGGRPLPGVTCRIAPSGEVLVKSPGTMLGYYRAEEQSRATVDEEGFLHTGDLGEEDERGRIRITGRLKEQFKTSKGKYVAPQPIETRLLAQGLLEQVCVAGESLARPYALPVLVPARRAAATAPGTGREALAERLGRLLAEINEALDPHERLERLVVLPEEWTVENGLLTPTLKIRRGAVEARYAGRVAEWATRPGAVVFA